LVENQNESIFQRNWNDIMDIHLISGFIRRITDGKSYGKVAGGPKKN
jgi:hypothetical protein